MSKTKRRPSIILDAGYVSIKRNDQYRTLNILGLHGKKLFCVILIIFSLFLISCINLTCLIWIMYKLDWSPFYKNGSKIFHFDKLNQKIEFYHQTKTQEAIYTMKINDQSPMNISSEKQMDIYGDYNSILLDENQISVNTEYFYMNNHSLVDFNNLYSFKFNENRTTRIHLDRINTEHIHSKHMNIYTDNNITISNVNNILFSGENLMITANKNFHRSVIRFNNNRRRKNSFNHRQKTSHGNIDFRINSIFLDLPRKPLVENIHSHTSGIYRICICNTTFLLLRSFAHQPCPLC